MRLEHRRQIWELEEGEPGRTHGYWGEKKEGEEERAERTQE